MTIKNDVTTAIDTAIDTMTTPTYNFSYGPVNVFKPASKTYPNVKTSYDTDEFDDPDNQVVDSYTSSLTATFTIVVDDTTAPARTALSDVLEDFQRLLESEHSSLQTDGMIKADLINSVREYSNIRKRPGKITMEWEIRYRIKRSDPALTQ